MFCEKMESAPRGSFNDFKGFDFQSREPWEGFEQKLESKSSILLLYLELL